MKFKKGNRWRSSSGKLKYTTWRRSVFEWCHNGFHYKYKFEALDKPELLEEYINEKNYKLGITKYIRENRNKKD